VQCEQREQSYVYKTHSTVHAFYYSWSSAKLLPGVSYIFPFRFFRFTYIRMLMKFDKRILKITVSGPILHHVAAGFVSNDILLIHVRCTPIYYIGNITYFCDIKISYVIYTVSFYSVSVTRTPRWRILKNNVLIRRTVHTQFVVPTVSYDSGFYIKRCILFPTHSYRCVLMCYRTIITVRSGDKANSVRSSRPKFSSLLPACVRVTLHGEIRNQQLAIHTKYVCAWYDPSVRYCNYAGRRNRWLTGLGGVTTGYFSNPPTRVFNTITVHIFPSTERRNVGELLVYSYCFQLW
jgi:hypothetical protein